MQKPTTWALLALALALFGCTHTASERRAGAEAPRSPDGGITRDDSGRSADAGLQWPLRGRISSGFGNLRSTHRHEGIDIRTESGTPIHAAAGGRVTFSGSMRGYGDVVILEHAAGLETRYAHNRRNLVQAGQRVKQGQVIAEVGASGNATAPHVHFEVRERGHVRDPMHFLPSLPASRR